MATQQAVAPRGETNPGDDPGFDDPMYDPGVDDHEPLNSAERETISADLRASGYTPEEAKTYLDDDGPDGARVWYRRKWRTNRALQDAQARRAALRGESAQNAPVSQMASDVVARDVAAHGSGARVGKLVGTGATSNPWVGILIGAIGAAVVGAVIGLLTAGPSNATGQPTGPVSVQQVGAAQPAAKLQIAPGATIDFTFSNVANSTCPAGSLGSGFGAGYVITLNPDGSIKFIHMAASPFAPDMTGTTSGTSVQANGAGSVDKQAVTGNFDRLNNPTSFTGKLVLTLPTASGKDCTAGFDAKGDIKGTSGGPAAPPPSLADSIHSDTGGPTSTGWLQMPGSIRVLLGAAVLLAIAALALALTEKPSYQEDDNDPNEYDDWSEYQGPPNDEPRAVVMPPGRLGFDPAPTGVVSQSDPPQQPASPPDCSNLERLLREVNTAIDREQSSNPGPMATSGEYKLIQRRIALERALGDCRNGGPDQDPTGMFDYEHRFDDPPPAPPTAPGFDPKPPSGSTTEGDDLGDRPEIG